MCRIAAAQCRLPREPRCEQRPSLTGEYPGRDVDTGVTKCCCPARRRVTRITERVDDRADPGRIAGTKRAERDRTGARPAGVVAGLERHDSGELPRPIPPLCRYSRKRVDLGVRGACAAVPALGDDATLRVQDHTADLRIRVISGAAACKREGTTHGIGDGLSLVHPALTVLARRVHRGPHRRWPCVPLIRTRLHGHPYTHHRRYRNSTGSAPQERSSRTLTAGSDSHRPRNTLPTVLRGRCEVEVFA